MTLDTANSRFRRTLLKAGLGLSLAGVLGLPDAAATSGGETRSTLKEVAPGILVHRGQHALFNPQNQGDIANAGFIVGTDGVAVIDAGGSARVGSALIAALRTVTDKPIRYLINTHMHPDHVFGNAAFEAEGAVVVGHHKLARALAARTDHYLAINKDLLGEEAFTGTRIVMPKLEVADRTRLDLGGRVLELSAQPTAHTDNDLIVRDLETGTVFMGDLLFSEHVPTLDGSIRGWLTLLDALGKTPAERVIPGHGPHSMPWPAAADRLTRYLTLIATEVRTMIKEGHTISDAVASVGLSEKSAWLLFDEYHARNVTATFAELEWE